MPTLKPDCTCALQRKARTVTAFAAEQSVLCSPVCGRRIAKTWHLSRISGESTADFLCSEDLLAERAGFELSVPFCTRKPRRVRKLQIAKHRQRISPPKPDSKFCNQSGFGSPSIRKLKANAKRFCGRKWSLERPRQLRGFARDCAPSGQSQNRSLHFGEKGRWKGSDFLDGGNLYSHFFASLISPNHF
jgi:hypothetical protein